jgi:hypothetical protein
MAIGPPAGEVPAAGAAHEVRAVLLWDLDNVAPPIAHLSAFAAVLGQLVGPDEPRVAAGHRRAFRLCRSELQVAGFEAWSGGRRRDGADRLLLRRAEQEAIRGARRYFVATNDQGLAPVAEFGDLYVVTRNGRLVGRRLAAVASGVFEIQPVADAWEFGLRHPKKCPTGDVT